MELDSDREDYLNIEENVYTLQDVDCITFVEKYAHPLSSCLECHKGDQDLCRFKNFRRIALSAARVGADLLGGRYTHWKKADSTTPDFLYAKSFTPRISRQDVNYLKGFPPTPLSDTRTLGAPQAPPSRPMHVFAVGSSAEPASHLALSEIGTLQG
ncbi:hypothetical protein PC9H_002720 [Pleurotus ostreatus]|uniref:Uncharacterized protein n=1 Tax=Pleurotus ostreatus TaxID=5322 RepID=A0A8H6ZKB0_PLEOS|nr:uncharacterized protein PC9H_002720 [Pleurotus ostreatus]KAF7416454.1 hypothetical protein PC9H_002720 [Pleurotus ostreatus]